MKDFNYLLDGWWRHFKVIDGLLAQADRAFAIFQPAYVAELAAEYDRCLFWLNFWGGEK